MQDKMSAEIIIEVPFYDLDPMNVVWHGNYLKYFERVRCVLLDKINYGYLKMNESGYLWPIIDVRLKYINSASFEQKLKCKATIVEYENRLKINYEIVSMETGKHLTKGYTIQVAIDRTSNEMQLVSPKVFLERLGISDANN
ncbi:MAG: acyl-CoA thioesterase [Gammaproteobacteria bacterium]|nr:acyl-CoA thioesterase [Gammaproteobacteria bacterium]